MAKIDQQNITVGEIQSALNEWAYSVQKSLDQKLNKELLTLTSKIYPTISSFSSWLMAFSGASLLLTFTENRHISPHLVSYDTLKFFWILLVINGVIGFLAKSIGVALKILIDSVKAGDELETLILELRETKQNILDGHSQSLIKVPQLEFSFNEAVGTLTGAMPCWAKPVFSYGFKIGYEDPLINHKRIAYLAPYFFLLTFFQILFLISTFVYFLCKMNF